VLGAAEPAVFVVVDFAAAAVEAIDPVHSA